MKAHDVPIRRVGDRPGQVFRHTCNNAKARATEVPPSDWARLHLVTTVPK